MITDQQIQTFDRELRALLHVDLPDVPADVRIEQEERCAGFVRKRISYAAGPGERVPAYLLVPDGRLGRGPAILAIHQHGGQFYLGKSEPAGLSRNAMYHYGADMARRGYTVLCPDQLCFEERRPPEWRRRDGLDPDDFWWERFEFGRFVLHGSTLQAKYLADLYRAFDVLAATDGVDPQRIGVMGHSLGGQETLWYTWFDRRVAAGFSSCGFALAQAIIDHHIIHNYAFYVPGFLKLGDTHMLVAAIAPRPFFFSAGEDDEIFPVESVRTIYAAAREVYARCRAEEKIESMIFPAGHSLPDSVKERAYAFLDRYLKR